MENPNSEIGNLDILEFAIYWFKCINF